MATSLNGNVTALRARGFMSITNEIRTVFGGAAAIAAAVIGVITLVWGFIMFTSASINSSDAAGSCRTNGGVPELSGITFVACHEQVKPEATR